MYDTLICYSGTHIYISMDKIKRGLTTAAISRLEVSNYRLNCKPDDITIFVHLYTREFHSHSTHSACSPVMGTRRSSRLWFLWRVTSCSVRITARREPTNAGQRAQRSANTEEFAKHGYFKEIAVEHRRRQLRFNLFIISNIPATRTYIGTLNTGIRHHFEEQSCRSVPLTIEEMWTGRQSHGRNHRYQYALAMNPHVDY